MSNRYLLDTNAAIAVLKNASALNAAFGPDDTFYLSLVTVGELSFGAYHSARIGQNLGRLGQFLHGVVVLPFDRETADEYGHVCAELRRKGRPIPANDIWIAAQARRFALPLVTRDGHFEAVEGLLCLSW